MAGDKKILASKLELMKKLGPPSPGGFTHGDDGEALEAEKKKPKKKKKQKQDTEEEE